MAAAAKSGGAGGYTTSVGATRVAAKVGATKTRVEILSTVAGQQLTAVTIPVVRSSLKKEKPNGYELREEAP